MKVKIGNAPVYLHSLGPHSVHVDVEHPMLHCILNEGERAACQGKGEHGIFIELSPKMTERAEGLLEMAQSPWAAEPVLLQQEIAGKLCEIAEILEFLGREEFRVRSYRRAAAAIQGTSKDLRILMESGKLKSIPGVGDSISAQIEQYIRTGRIDQLNALSRELPAAHLLQDQAIDARTAIMLERKLGIRTMKELERAYVEGRLVLGMQPLTLEDRVILAVFRRRAGAFAGVLDLLVEDLALVESLRRRFTPRSVAYDLAPGRSTLFRLHPNPHKGIHIIFSRPDRLAELPIGPTASIGWTQSTVAHGGNRSRILVSNREQAWEFCRAIERQLRAD